MYSNSPLYNDKEPLEALPLGALQMLAPSLASFGRLGLKNVEVPDLPSTTRGSKTPSAFWSASRQQAR